MMIVCFCFVICVEIVKKICGVGSAQEEDRLECERVKEFFSCEVADGQVVM